MDMDNASWAIEQLRVANEANESDFVASPFVSQFRIDGQPILPPLMTAERRRQMLLLKQQALQLEAQYKQQQQQPHQQQQPPQAAQFNDSCSSNSNCSSKSNSSSSSNNSSSMNTVQRSPQQLQQTPTFIYDSTKHSKDSPRCRPQTLQLHNNSSNNSIPSICVKPPTPLEPPPQQQQLANETMSDVSLLCHTRRKLNNISSRIMRFEQQARDTPLELLWNKRMSRSSTSPALLQAAARSEEQLQRSRSFTLEEPSPALLAHMQQQQLDAEVEAATAIATATVPTTITTALSPRCRFANLRRDTVESKAKQVQRHSSDYERRCGGNQRTLQQQQQQLKQLLQRALHEADDVLDEQQEQERKQLTLAKRQMFKDIKVAHRDRFQQLVQYQHEEQRRMQAEFDRQQRQLIEQICADINVSLYAPHSDSSPSRVPVNSIHTSTDDLQPREALSLTAAKKRLFVDGSGADTESDVASDLLPLDSSPQALNHSNSNNNSSSNKNNSNRGKLKKPLQQRKLQSSPASQASTAPKTPPARRVVNKTLAKTKPQQATTTTTTLSKTRRSVSPSRQSLPTALEQQRREEAATLLCAVTRGFLVRRLFRTEQVQRIVQTIRDTLIFVLNLHMETTIGGIDQEEPANIRLKARLLQQLCSASRTLHLIFFQTSIKERMEIIARDRKRIKTKLMALHVKQRQ